MVIATKAEKKRKKKEWFLSTYGPIWIEKGWLRPETVYGIGPVDTTVWDNKTKDYFCAKYSLRKERGPEFDAMSEQNKLKSARQALLYDLVGNSLNSRHFKKIIDVVNSYIPSWSYHDDKERQYFQLETRRERARDKDIIKKYDPRQFSKSLRFVNFSPEAKYSQKELERINMLKEKVPKAHVVLY